MRAHTKVSWKVAQNSRGLSVARVETEQKSGLQPSQLFRAPEFLQQPLLRASDGNPRADSPLRRCNNSEVWLCSCPTSESIFQDLVECCWDLDTTEKWHILSVWAFLLFPLPLPHLITGVSCIPQILPPQSSPLIILFFPSAFQSLHISTTSNMWREPYVLSEK